MSSQIEDEELHQILERLWTAGRLVGKEGASPEQWAEIANAEILVRSWADKRNQAAYQQGRIDEAKTCEKARRHDMAATRTEVEHQARINALYEAADIVNWSAKAYRQIMERRDELTQTKEQKK